MRKFENMTPFEDASAETIEEVKKVVCGYMPERDGIKKTILVRVNDHVFYFTGAEQIELARKLADAIYNAIMALAS
jgi:hypothetical protein